MTLSTRIPSSRRHWNPLPLASLQGGVHRFTAVVGHLDPGSPDGKAPASLRLHKAQLADSKQPLACEALDVPLGDVWLQAGVQEGDTVLFTAKVPRRPQLPTPTLVARGVVVLRRRQTNAHRLRSLEIEQQQLRQQLEQLEADAERMQEHRDGLLADNSRLQQALASQTTGIKAECRSRQQLQQAIRGFQRRLLGTTLLALLAGGGLGLGLATHAARPAGDGIPHGTASPQRQ